jgi:hypothetical protein
MELWRESTHVACTRTQKRRHADEQPRPCYNSKSAKLAMLAVFQFILRKVRPTEAPPLKQDRTSGLLGAASIRRKTKNGENTGEWQPILSVQVRSDILSGTCRNRLSAASDARHK